MRDLASLLPKFGRPVDPGDSSAIPSSRELQVHYVAATAKMLAISGAVLCLAVTWCFWTTVPTSMLLAWTGMTLLALFPVPVMLHKFEERSYSDAEAQILIKWIGRFAIARALAWGVGAAVFYEYASPMQLTLLCVLAVGNAMGSGSALMSIPRTASLFALCSVSPLALSFFLSGRTENIIVGVLLLVYALGMRSAAGQTMSFVQSEADLRRALVDQQREFIKAKIEAESANRTKSDFLAHMSHELRTPLNAIIGFSEAIAGQMFGPVAPRYAAYAGDINSSGKHLLNLINDVLDLSKVEAGALTVHESEVDVGACAAVVERLVRERAQKKRLSVKWQCEGAPLVVSDERIVQQILINLVTNAIKFTPEGGAVRVAARITQAGDLALSVSDNGIGMTAEEIAIALTPFGQVGSNMTAREEGSGLGLPLCQRFAGALGGALAIDSAPGQGTTVTLTLPAPRIAPSAAPAVLMTAALSA